MVAVALGVTVLGESLGAGAIAGLLLILAGSWLATDGRLPPGLARLISRVARRRPGPPSSSEGPGRAAQLGRTGWTAGSG